MTSHEQMIEDCCEAEEKIGLDELEAFASKQRAQKQLARAEADKIGGQVRTRRGTDGFGNPVLEVIDREGRKVGQVFQGKDTSAQAIAERMLADI